MRSFAEESGRKLGKVAQPLRAALTGKSTSPGIFDVLGVLGREESLARLRDQAAAYRDLLNISATPHVALRQNWRDYVALQKRVRRAATAANRHAFVGELAFPRC